MPRGGPTIADLALQVIHERGPQELDALVPAIVDAGRTSAKDPRRAVAAAIENHPAFLRAWDGRWCSLVDQLEGAIFATRTTALERRRGFALVRNHLFLVEQLARLRRGRPRPGDVHLEFFADLLRLRPPFGGFDSLDAWKPSSGSSMLEVVESESSRPTPTACRRPTKSP